METHWTALQKPPMDRLSGTVHYSYSPYPDFNLSGIRSYGDVSPPRSDCSGHCPAFRDRKILAVWKFAVFEKAEIMGVYIMHYLKGAQYSEFFERNRHSQFKFWEYCAYIQTDKNVTKTIYSISGSFCQRVVQYGSLLRR